MTAKLIQCRLYDIQGEALDYVDEVAPWAGGGDVRPQIVERYHGRYTIVDGFGRTAGQIRHCRDNGIDTREHMVDVVLACEDDGDNDLVAAAAEPGPGQETAIEEIYRQAGCC